MQTEATLVRLPGAPQPLTNRACFYSPAPPAQRTLLTPQALRSREKTQALNRPPIWGRSIPQLLEGEGSMVLRRTVCGRRPWSEALAGGGPSIPLPVHASKGD